MAAEPSHSSIIPMPPKQPMAARPQPSADHWMTADKCLNYFVGAVALMERLGNCLGTLAFTWATVVVLGGFSTNLGLDFWYATAIVFLEAFRMFIRESGSDDELLFKTTGSIKLKRMKLSGGIPYYLTVSIVIVCLYGTVVFSLRHYGYSPAPHLRLQYHILLLSVLLALASVAQAPTCAECLKDNAWMQFLSALVAVLALGAAMLWSQTPKREVVLIIPPLFVGCLQSVFKEIGACLESSPLFVGCLQSVFKEIGVCLSSCNGLGLPSKFLRACVDMLVPLILPAWIVISVLLEFRTMGVFILLGTLLLGSIQIPVAVARIVLSSVRLSSTDNHNAGNEHLAPALTIFYSMVLAQGILYSAACVLESLLSSLFRMSLARSCKLTYSKGYESINLYYEHAYSKRMKEGVLAQEDMRLVTFAFNSLDANSNDNKLAAVQILHSLLQLKGAFNAKLVSEITTSAKVVASLINMLGWTSASDDEQGISIRFFTAKVIASVAGDLRIVGIPGAMQMISSLLDIDAKKKKGKQDISNQIVDKSEVNINDNQKQIHASSTLVNIQGGHGYHAPTNGEELSKQVEGGNRSQRSNFNFLDCISNQYDLEEGNEPSMDMDSFPILGMLILERLAHDLDNCVEIGKATQLIPKIIGFIIKTTDTTNKIMTSALQLIAKLVNTEGEIGMTTRQKILDGPFFFSNLVEILEDNNSHSKQWKLTMVIIAKIVLEDETSKDIERFHAIIPKLMHAFLGPNESSNTNFDRTLRILAGKALSKLAAKNTSFCMTIFEEKGYGLIGDLKNMLQQDEYTYVAASLLTSLCAHFQKELHLHRPSEQLSSILRVVLEKILDAEGQQLEALIITASQLHNLIPQQFALELFESRINKENFVQKLVGTLTSNKKMCLECPRMRRVIVEITISIVESCPYYSQIFRSERMMEALSKVERILAKVEKYKAFLGDTIVVFNSGLPPSDLVTKAKHLIGSETPNQEDNVHDSSSLDIVHVN